MKRTLWNMLGLSMKTGKVLAAVGGGGKTSLLFQLAREASGQGMRVLLTTTTHLAWNPELCLADGSDRESLEKAWEKGLVPVAGRRCEKGRKIQGLTQEERFALEAMADVTLVEADGSRQKPVKVPASWEPVIPPEADTVVAVLGMKALGEEICRCGHRPELLAAFLGKSLQETVTEEDLVRMALSPKGLRKSVEERNYVVVLNQCDCLRETAAAERVIEAVRRKGISCFGVSLKEWMQ